MKIKIVSASMLVVFALCPAPAFAGQPHMKAALDHLQAARIELQKAAADKAGYRQKAMDLVDRAIIETARGEEAARQKAPKPARR
ncbi:MAG: hypothetical protein ABI883_00240 [Chthoniobacterales bacterium]